MTGASAGGRTSSAALVGGLYFVLACVFWGMNIPLTAELFKTFDPFWLGFIRVSLAALILAGMLLLSKGKGNLRSPIPLWRIMILGGLASCFFTLYNLGLRYTNTLTAAAILAGSPVYGAVVSRFMTGGRLQTGFWGAAVLTLIGAGVAIYGRARASGQSFHLQGGEILIVLGISAWAAYSILSVRWFEAETPQLRRTFLSLGAASVWLLLWWALAYAVGIAGPGNFNPDGTALTYLLLTAFLATVMGIVAWGHGVARLGVSTGMMWQNTVPVFAVLISLVFFSVIPLPEQVLGGAIVLAGVVYMQWQQIREQAT